MDPVWLNGQNITEAVNSSEVKSVIRGRLEALDAPMRAFMIVLYSSTSFLAFLGNLVVIVVEIFGKRSVKNLRKFLINLAISDILFGVFCVPFTYTDFMLGQWIFPLWLCPFAQFVQILSVFVTAFTLTVIGIERYFAILCPLSNRSVVQWFNSRCHILLAIGWLFGGMAGLVAMYYTTVDTFEWNNSTFYDCRGAEMDPMIEKIYNTSFFILTFGLPLLIQTFSYASIGKELLKDNCINNKLNLRRNSGHENDRTKVIRMLVAVVIIFFICWFPIKIFMLLMVYFPEIFQLYDNFSYYRYVSGFFFCHWLAMANSFVNPIIYSFMSKSFRADLKDVFLTFRKSSMSSPKQMNQISYNRTGYSPPTEKTTVRF